MTDLDSTAPRVFLAHHGETEWTKNGRYTGTTELELTPKAVEQVIHTSSHLVGPGKLIDPARIARIWVSPRKRALQTYRLLFNVDDNDDYGFGELVEISEDIAEWDYGDYEGLRVGEIRSSRKERGLDEHKEWNIWRDGCERGESAQQLTERLDRLISQIRDLQRPCMDGSKPADVVLVAHGIILL